MILKDLIKLFEPWGMIKIYGKNCVYEAIREILPKITKPVDCIFVVYTKEIATMDFKELKSLIVNLLKEADIL